MHHKVHDCESFLRWLSCTVESQERLFLVEVVVTIMFDEHELWQQLR